MTEPPLPDPNPGPGSDPIADQLLAHAAAMARLNRQLDQLRNEVTDLAAELVTRVDDLEKATPMNGLALLPTSWCWRTLGTRGQEELWQQLTSWVAWIRCRYPLSRRIPECWPQHPEIVEELTALWLAWVQAYETSDAPLTSGADWHDRWLPGLLHRLEHGPFALDCSTAHHPRPTTAYATRVPAD